MQLGNKEKKRDCNTSGFKKTFAGIADVICPKTLEKILKQCQ
jgi:hypothetical protein